EAQMKAFTDQISSIRSEAKDIAPLVERGLISRPRILQLERTAFGLEGQIADAMANIAKARQAIAEQQQQIAQLANDRTAAAYKQRIVPIIHGDVIQVSADRLTDPKTNNPYYVAFFRIDADELAAMPNIKLYPGMPATVMIPTIQRTALDFIVGPLVMSFNHS